MSGVNSKYSLGDLTTPSPPTSADARIGLTEPTGIETSPESPVERVLRIPDELLPDIFGYLAADSDLEALTNVRLVCSLWKREAFFALKTNLDHLPWIEAPAFRAYGQAAVFRNGNRGPMKTLRSCTRNLKPGCGLPLQLVVHQWSPELESFLRDFSSDIVNFRVCGRWLKRGYPDYFQGFDGFHGLEGIELPSLEHATFSADSIRNIEEDCDKFVKALTFWNELVKVSKNLKTPQISLSEILDHGVLPDHEIFDLLEWSQVSSLGCSYEFFAQLSAATDLSSLQKLECYSFSSIRAFRDPDILEIQVSLEKAANLTEMSFGFNENEIEWVLSHPMKNLKVLTMGGIKITCGRSLSTFLPKLEKITVFDCGDFSLRSPISCLISGEDVFENVVELKLKEGWSNMNERIGDVAVRLCEVFPKLTQLEWQTVGWMGGGRGDNIALKAAPAIFSKLEHLTRLMLKVATTSEREVVELVTGITLEEIPEEEGTWPTTLVGNPRSIVNLKHLQSFRLRVSGMWEWGRIFIPAGHARFLFIGAFRTMATLEKLHFQNINFEDIHVLELEWEQMGRIFEVEFNRSDSSNSE